MNRKTMLAAGLGVAAIAIAAVGGWYLNEQKKQEAFRAQVQPVVKKVSERIQATAALTRGASARESLERSEPYLADLQGLSADLDGLYREGPRQEALVAAGQEYVKAAQAFVRSHRQFTRALTRLEAARGKLKESLDAKVRTSQFSLDFWKETHDRLTLALEAVRKEAAQARGQLVATTNATQTAADTAAAVLGREVVVSVKTLADHRKALEDLPLAKDS